MISIIVPAYNVEKYIDKCIDSIVNQTYRDIEIIIIDDASTDETGKKCDEWAKKDSRITVIHKKNEGVSEARNDGINHSKGEYIAFVDSDDFIHPAMMEIMLKALTDYDADISICKEYAFNEDEEPDYTGFNNEIKYKVEKIEDMNGLLSHFTDRFTGPIGWPWNKLYTRRIIENNKFVRERILEDLIFNSLVLQNVKKAVWIDERLYYYRQWQGSAMNSNKSKMYTDYCFAIEQERKNLYPVISIELKKRCAAYFLKKLSSLEMDADIDGLKEEAKSIRKKFNEIYFTDIKLVDSIKDRMQIFMYKHFYIVYHFFRKNILKCK